MTVADLPAVQHIESQSPSPWNYQQLSEELAIPNAVQLVCRSSTDQLLIGFLMARLLDDESEILKIATAQEFQRQGVASLLLQSFIAIARQRGISRFYLELRSNNAPALALYEKNAFEMTGRRPHYYTDPKDDAFCMTMTTT